MAEALETNDLSNEYVEEIRDDIEERLENIEDKIDELFQLIDNLPAEGLGIYNVDEETTDEDEEEYNVGEDLDDVTAKDEFGN